MVNHYCAHCNYTTTDISNYKKHCKTSKHDSNKISCDTKKNIVIPYEFTKNPYMKTETETVCNKKNGNWVHEPVFNSYSDPVIIAKDLFKLFTDYHQISEGYMVPFKYSFDIGPYALYGLRYQLAKINNNNVEYIPYSGADLFDDLFGKLRDVYIYNLIKNKSIKSLTKNDLNYLALFSDVGGNIVEKYFKQKLDTVCLKKISIRLKPK